MQARWWPEGQAPRRGQPAPDTEPRATGQPPPWGQPPPTPEAPLPTEQPLAAAEPRLEAALTGDLGSFRLQVSFAVPMSGVTALFGPSGSGKTTILRCIAGLQHLPGRLQVGAETWQDHDRGVFRKPHRRAVGYVFQEASLFPHLTVHGNLLYGARRAGEGPQQLAFDDVVELLGIRPLLARAPAALSGGERQRVAVGRALLSRPRLLLMDEPLSALDQPAREEILAYFETLHRQLSIPIVYVSHDLAEVTRLADHLVVLAGGSTVAAGPLRELLERLDLQPAAGRLDAEMVLDATVTAHDRRYHLTRLDHHGQTITVPAIELAVGAPLRVRIRARDVALTTSRPQAISMRNVLAGTVVALREELDTAYAEALVDIGGGRLRAKITREAVHDLALQVGSPVFALIKSVSLQRGA